MPQRLFITLGSRRRKDRVLLELPGDKSIQELIPDLIQVLGWKEFAGIMPSALRLESEEGEPLAGNKTLFDSNVTSSDLLFLTQSEPSGAPAKANSGKGELQQAEGTSNSTAGKPSVSPKAPEFLQHSHLLGPRGLVFLLDRLPLIIGRTGKGGTPDIDLAEWDAKMIVSRKHAVIEQAKDGLSLRSEKTTNGTFINGVEVPAGESKILRDGDRIQFGFQGLELVFKAAES